MPPFLTNLLAALFVSGYSIFTFILFVLFFIFILYFAAYVALPLLVILLIIYFIKRSGKIFTFKITPEINIAKKRKPKNEENIIDVDYTEIK